MTKFQFARVFFVMNDDLLIDFESMHMLQCTVCKKKKYQIIFCPKVQILKIVD